MNLYIPRAGDFVKINFNPQSGHEQKGKRPALVFSNKIFNQKTAFAFLCPITNTNRNIPFHIPIPKTCLVTGFVMIDQIKSIDYKSRKIQFIETAPKDLLIEAISILDACLP